MKSMSFKDICKKVGRMNVLFAVLKINRNIEILSVRSGLKATIQKRKSAYMQTATRQISLHMHSLVSTIVVQ